METALKRLLLGTGPGLWLLSTRDKLALVRAAWRDPEGVGTLANDQLASLLVTSICREGKVFVDVGAHIGSIIACTRSRSHPSRIVAVEAIPEKAAAIRRSFPRVEVFGCAVGERDDADVAFFVDCKRSGYSSLAKGGGGPSRTEIKVPLRTLDGLLASREVDVVKIDIEGGELGALRGAVGVLSERRPTVMFESAPGAGRRHGDGKDELWNFLHALDYEIVAPNRLAHDGGAMSLEAFNDGHLYPRRTTNYFAVARERRVELRDRARVVLGISGPSAAANDWPVGVSTSFRETR